MSLIVAGLLDTGTGAAAGLHPESSSTVKRNTGVRARIEKTMLIGNTK
jgi:hypothetical protein